MQINLCREALVDLCNALQDELAQEVERSPRTLAAFDRAALVIEKTYDD